MASAADRRRAQREIAKQLKEGGYQQSKIGRESAKLARERRQKPIFDRDSTKDRVKQKKREFWDTVRNFKGGNSDSIVDDSNAYDEMREFLDSFDEETAIEYASQAAIAHIQLRATGDAGDLDIYLPYDFLFYH